MADMMKPAGLFVVIVFGLLCGLGQGSAVREKRADDLDGAQALQALFQQQAATISNLQAQVASLSNLQTQVASLRSEVQALNTAVAFTTTFSADDPNLGIQLSAGATLAFDHVVTNVGNGYNPATGIFTAPATGTYAFSLHMMVPKTIGAMMLSILKDSAVLDKVWALTTSQNDDDEGATVVTTTLTRGQQVWVVADGAGGVRGSYWTVFTGYLIQAQ